jgi:small-conductance mechanosensitive channel
MKEILNFEFSEFSLLGVIISAFLLAILLKIFTKFFISRMLNQRIRNYYPLFLVIVWISFLVWSINILLQDSLYRTVAILSLAALILASIAWFISRDLFAGLVLRFTDSFYNGQSLSIDQKSGRINNIGMLGISIQQSDGTEFKVPWSKISGQIYRKDNTDDVSNMQNFKIEISQKYPMEIVQAKIREAVFLSVGAALKKEPQIKLLSSQDGEWQMEITTFAISPQYFRTIETNVKNALSKVLM